MRDGGTGEGDKRPVGRVAPDVLVAAADLVEMMARCGCEPAVELRMHEVRLVRDLIARQGSRGYRDRSSPSRGANMFGQLVEPLITEITCLRSHGCFETWSTPSVGSPPGNYGIDGARAGELGEGPGILVGDRGHQRDRSTQGGAGGASIVCGDVPSLVSSIGPNPSGRNAVATPAPAPAFRYAVVVRSQRVPDGRCQIRIATA